MTHPARCRHCDHRRSLKRRPEDYLRAPACPHCGGRSWRLDKYRMKEKRERIGVFNTCHCDGLPYPHRAGSDVWCRKHPTGPTEEDFRGRYGR